MRSLCSAVLLSLGLGCFICLTTALPVAAQKHYVDMLYMTNAAGSQIIRADLDGALGLNLGNPGGFGNDLEGLAFDHVNRQIYLTSSVNDRIIRCDLGGKYPVNLGNPGGFLDQPMCVALDPVNNHMYISSWSNDRLVRVDLDGANPVNIGNPGALLNGPRGIALDLANGHMYVVSALNNRIVRTDLDGNNPVNLGNPDEVTIAQVAQEVIDLTGGGSTIVYRPLPEDDPKVRRPDIRRARDVLGWEPQVDRRVGLQRTVEDFREALGRTSVVS